MTYHYLFTDDDGATLARVRYHFTPLHPGDRNGPPEGDELVLDEVIPPSFEVGRREEITLRHHAALLDLDEASSLECSQRIDYEPLTSPIHWGVKG